MVVSIAIQGGCRKALFHINSQLRQIRPLVLLRNGKKGWNIG